jgi:hypothetical protein
MCRRAAARCVRSAGQTARSTLGQTQHSTARHKRDAHREKSSSRATTAFGGSAAANSGARHARPPMGALRMPPSPPRACVDLCASDKQGRHSQESDADGAGRARGAAVEGRCEPVGAPGDLGGATPASAIARAAAAAATAGGRRTPADVLGREEGALGDAAWRGCVSAPREISKAHRRQPAAAVTPSTGSARAESERVGLDIAQRRGRAGR